MQTDTPITIQHRGKLGPPPSLLIVGSTPGAELPELLKILNHMGGHVLPPDATPRWQALLEDFNGAVSAVERFEKALDPAQKPALLPVAFDIKLPSLQQVMANLDNVALLLFYSRPEAFLMKAMSAETSAAMALAKWCTASESMLKTIQRYRSRTVLFNSESAFRSAAAFKDLCWERFRLKGRSEDMISVPPRKPVSAVHQLIAAQMVVQSAEVQDLLDELEASAVPSDTLSVMPKVNCEDALAEWRGQGESDQLKEVNELLLMQLHQVQEELESHYLRLHETEKKLRETEEKLRETEEKLGETEEKLGETRGELTSRNALIERRNKSLEDKDKTSRAKVNELERHLAETRDTLTRIRQSLSWKLTKPLRDIRGLSRRRFRRQGPA